MNIAAIVVVVDSDEVVVVVDATVPIVGEVCVA